MERSMEGTAPLFVDVEWLSSMVETGAVTPIDCRFVLGSPNAGREAFAAGHIPGARYADLEHDLSDAPGTTGGRHPLPDAKRFGRFLSRACVTSQTHVVAYDEYGDMAPRLWWLMRYFSAGRASVLQGGIHAWTAAGFRLDRGEPRPCEGPAPSLSPRPDLVLGYEDVRRRLEQDAGFTLIDSRAPERFRGAEEPIDPVAGHIPGARSIYWQLGLKGPSEWRSADELKALFADLPTEGAVAAYCGSGVTACANILSLRAAGVDALLYAGSWSDWCNRPGSPVATGE